MSRRPDITIGRRPGFRGFGDSSVPSPGAILGANLTGWWDDGSATVTGATWTNRTGGTNFTQGTGANQPPAGTAINGRATIQPDGVSDFMDAGAISGLLTASAFGVWAVVRPLGTLIAGPPVGTATSLFVTDTGGYIALGCATDARGILFDTGYKITTTPGTMVSGTVYQVRLYLSGGTLRYRVKNASAVVGEGSVASGNIGAMTGTLRLGRSYLTNYQQADFGAIVTCNAAPSSAQLTAIDTWTRSKWGV